MRAAPHAPVPSWWIGLAPRPFYAKVHALFPEMSNSKEGRRVASVQGLQEKKLTGQQRSKIRLEH